MPMNSYAQISNLGVLMFLPVLQIIAIIGTVLAGLYSLLAPTKIDGIIRDRDQREIKRNWWKTVATHTLSQ